MTPNGNVKEITSNGKGSYRKLQIPVMKLAKFASQQP